MQTIYRRHCTLSHFSLNIYLFCQPSIFNISPSTPKVIHHNTSPPESYASCHTTAVTAAKFPPPQANETKVAQTSSQSFQKHQNFLPNNPGKPPTHPTPTQLQILSNRKEVAPILAQPLFFCFGFSPKLFFCSSSQYRR